MDELFAEIDLGSARGRQESTSELSAQIVRALTEEDIPLLLAPPPVASPTPITKIMRHSHHQMARLVALGEKDVRIAEMTGYSAAYICNMKASDPAFRELVEYYSVQREQIFVDTLERMRVLGINTLEELSRRLEEDSNKWTNRELMEMAKLMLVDPQAALRGTPGSGAPPVQVNVKFVTAGSGTSAPTKPRVEPGVVDLEHEDLEG